MSDSHILFLVRTFHSTIYIIVAVSVVFLLVSALLGYFGPLLLVALICVGIEVIVFVARFFGLLLVIGLILLALRWIRQ
jgi:hypothetical protein